MGGGGTSGSAGTAGSAGASVAGTTGTAGTSGAAGSSGGGATGGAGATGTGGAGAGGTGGGMTGGSGGASGMLGCEISDPPPSAVIADFEAVDGGAPVIPIGGTFFYPAGGPSAVVVNGAWHITAATVGMTSAQYWWVGIYFNGNAAGTDCVDAAAYTGVQFDIKGSIAGTGCSAQYATNDSAHADHTMDPKGSGPVGSYAPQASLTATGTTQTIKMPFTGTGAPSGGSPALAVDKDKLIGVQWQFTTAAGTSTSCNVDVTIDNVKFY